MWLVTLFRLKWTSRKAARAAWTGPGETADNAFFDIFDKYGATDFLGYDTEFAQAQVIAIVKDGLLVDSAAQGDSIQVVFNQTPFYVESGGQIGDTINFKNGEPILLIPSALRVFSFTLQK